MAEDEGFEPPQTESESGVLPLHKSSIARTSIIIHNLCQMSRDFFQILIFLPESSCPEFRILFHLFRKGFSLQNRLPQVAERLLFPLVPEHGQDELQLHPGIGMHQLPLPAAHEVVQR